MAVMAVAWSVRMGKVPLPILVLEGHKLPQVYILAEVTANPLLSARVVTVPQEQQVVRAAEAGMAAHLAHVQMAVALVGRVMFCLRTHLRRPDIFLLIPIIFSQIL